MMKTSVYTPQAPLPMGPFSQAVMAGNLVFTSALLALDTATGKLMLEDIETETRQVMENLKTVLHQAGVDMNNVVKASIFLRNMDDYQAVNKVYSSFFQEPFPARETFAVAGLPANVNIEIAMIAIKNLE